MVHFLPVGSWKYFPYPSFKPTQETLLSVVCDSIKQNSHAIVDGASGLGKTVGALAGALEACKQRDIKILYAARTYKELDRVIEELVAINRRQKVSGISIRGRAEMCINDAVLQLSHDSATVMELCTDLMESGKCPYYSKVDEDAGLVRGVMNDFLSAPVSAYELISRSRREGLCPYEITRLLLPNVDVVALNYAYLFNRQIRDSFTKKLKRSLSQYALILDEAHNLPEIANEFESDHLSSASISATADEADHYGKANVRRFAECLLRAVNKAERKEQQVDFKAMAEEAAREGRVGDTLPIFLEASHAFGESIKAILLSKGKLPRSHIHRLSEFFLCGLETSGRPDFVHLLQTESRDSGNVDAMGFGNPGRSQRLEIVSLDPRSATREVIESVLSTVSMSGTLENAEAYQQVMGLPECTLKVSLPSPFSEDQTLLLACKGLSTLYEKRGEEVYSKMVSKISEVVRSTPGNTGVFCSSYEVLTGLLHCGLEESLTKPLFIERQRTRSTDHDQMIEEFKAMGLRGGGVLLGVMGGRFSEGEDYPGNEMNSVVIVGVPYPKPTVKVNSQINYYGTVFPGKGKDYGYILPAMRKASQAAGRPFRNLDDRGVVVFLDYRYSTRYLESFLPRWIRERIKVVDEYISLGNILADFYTQQPIRANQDSSPFE
jgi:DNA excision repair protein ERCC-2